MTLQEALNAHQQLRLYSCFQMAPELSLKLSGILSLNSYPFQSQPWDGKGYEPYRENCKIGKLELQFLEINYKYPYEGMFDRFREELNKGKFPVVSLMPELNRPSFWHGYVVVQPIDDNDFVIASKIGSVDSGQCESLVDKLSNKLKTKGKVDALFWQVVENNPNNE